MNFATKGNTKCSPILTNLLIERKLSLPVLTHIGVFRVWVVPESSFLTSRLAVFRGPIRP